MSKIAINTSQNVNINFSLASIGDRMFAFFIDSAIKVAYLLVLTLILRAVSRKNYIRDLLDNFDNWEVMAIIGIITLPIHIYTLVCESLMEGQTIGKKLMKIKVIKIDGYQASFADYLLRWLFRIVDILTNGGLVGVLSIMMSKNNQRLGDMVAGTAVISLKNKVNISHTILEHIGQEYVPTFPQVIAFSDNDMRIIKDNFQKASLHHDTRIIHQLSNKIKEILKIEVEHRELTEKKFIEIIIKDYNYFTGKES